MRRQVNWLVLAVTGLVVVAFVVPLGLLVRRQAVERAQIAAEQRAQSVAAAMAVSVAASGESSPEVAEGALVAEATIVLPDGSIVGLVPPEPQVIQAVMAGESASAFDNSGRWIVGIPVATAEGVVAILAEASPATLSAGVGRATATLAMLAAALVVGSVLVADRLGSSLVRPVTDLAIVASALGAGDLDARAEVTGPPEIQRVASALNELASRLDDIITNEREALADLSHRLRTPLTALRLQAEQMADSDERRHLLGQIERTRSAVDQLIGDVRDRGRGQRAASSDLATVVQDRMAFWAVLASDQGRAVHLDIEATPAPVGVGARDLGAAVDAIVGNVFAHTPAGTDFAVTVAPNPVPTVTVSDSGPGWPRDAGVVDRGVSGAGSTGLGLDIARSLAERLGGTLETDEGPSGGALIVLRLGG